MIRDRLDRLFPVLLGLFALLKGLAVGGALMPFEGWDEYQHLSVAAFVAEQGRMPSTQDRVPAGLHRFLASQPHPEHSARDLAGLAVRTYREEEWDPAMKPGGPAPRLYQAQHGPLYYHGAAWLLRLLPADELASWADLLRGGNALLGAAVVLAWYGALRGLLPGRRRAARLLALLLAASPLAAFSHARAANDALAVLLGALALLVYARARRDEKEYRPALLLGLLAGLAVLAKAVGLVVAALLAVAWPARIWRRSPRRAVATALCFLGMYGAVAGPFHLRHLRQDGTLTGMIEAVENRRAQRGPVELARAAAAMDLRRVAGTGLHHTLFVGGWSFVPPRNTLALGYAAVLYSGLALLGVGLLFPAGRRRLATSAWTTREMVALLLLMQLALLYHALESSLMVRMLTNPWYGVLTLPALYGLVLTGPALVRPRWALLMGLLLLLIQTLVYYLGTYGDLRAVQVPGVGPWEALQVIRSSHPILGPVFPLALLGEALLLPALVGLLLSSAGGEPPAQQRAQ